MAQIILDTDIGLDVDDAGAVAVLHALADRGECDILGIGVCTSSQVDDGLWAARTVSVLNRFYGRAEIPIGIYHGPHLVPDRIGHYTRVVASSFPHDINDAALLPHAWTLYRRLLAEHDDVTIVSIGFLNNLRELLQSPPDAHSPLPGRELVQQRVRRWVCMGGQFPSGGEEYNFNTYGRDTRYVLQHWPTKAVFLDGELGAKVKTGGGLIHRHDPAKHPLTVCWKEFNRGSDRESWDQMTALYAVRGEQSGLVESEPGRTSYHTDGAWIPNVLMKSRTPFTPDPNGLHTYLKPAVPLEQIAHEINALMDAAD